MRAHPVVLCLQDTTELDFNGQRIAGLGPLSYEPIDPARICLNLVTMAKSGI
jgi:hypothetical protein